MLIINKYKNNLNLNYNNFFNRSEINIYNNSYIHFLYDYKVKIVRLFLNFFSFFLQFYLFSPMFFKKDNGYKINLEKNLISLLNNYYNEFHVY